MYIPQPDSHYLKVLTLPLPLPSTFSIVHHNFQCLEFHQLWAIKLCCIPPGTSHYGRRDSNQNHKGTWPQSLSTILVTLNAPQCHTTFTRIITLTILTILTILPRLTSGIMTLWRPFTPSTLMTLTVEFQTLLKVKDGFERCLSLQAPLCGIWSTLPAELTIL